MRTKLLAFTVEPAGEADIGGNNTGFLGAFVYILSLLITLADEIEIVVLKKMRKKTEEARAEEGLKVAA